MSKLEKKNFPQHSHQIMLLFFNFVVEMTEMEIFLELYDSFYLTKANFIASI